MVLHGLILVFSVEHLVRIAVHYSGTNANHATPAVPSSRYASSATRRSCDHPTSLDTCATSMRRARYLVEHVARSSGQMLMPSIFVHNMVFGRQADPTHGAAAAFQSTGTWGLPIRHQVREFRGILATTESAVDKNGLDEFEHDQGPPCCPAVGRYGCQHSPN